MASFGIINNNQAAIFALRGLNATGKNYDRAHQRLSSGQKINSAADDAAGMTVTEKMRAQLYGIDQARRNTQDGISMVQTAEAGLSSSQTILHRMRTLAIQASNDSYTTYDRRRIQTEIDQLVNELDRISQYSEFNTKKLLNGDTIGVATPNRKEIAHIMITDEVVSADYSITVLDAGTASNVHGNANISGEDGLVNLKNAGINGDAELHIEVDGMTRVLLLNEKETLKEVAARVNRANMGIVAGLDVEGNDLTLTSVRSGSRFNIGFGKDPDGVAMLLGLVGGAERTLTSEKNVVDSQGNSLDIPAFTTGTDTIISITNISIQDITPTKPGSSDEPGGTGKSLGIFRSNSDIFTATELMNPINSMSLLDIHQQYAGAVPGWAIEAGKEMRVSLENSGLLKGMTIHIDEQLDRGILQMSADDDGEAASVAEPFAWTSFFPDPFSGGDYYSRGRLDHRAMVPEERLVGDNLDSLGQIQKMSLTSVHVSVRSMEQSYQIGANSGQNLKTGFANISAEALGLAISMPSDGLIHDGMNQSDSGVITSNLTLTVSVDTQESAGKSLEIINSALLAVSGERTRIGSLQNAMEATSDYLNISYEEGPQSKIRDADMAKEAAELAKQSVLMKSSQAMLSQANMTPQSVLSLLG